MLTREAGLLRAAVFGGPKSRLRSYASPFHSGQAWVYHDPVKDTRKLSDFDVRSWRPGLRELYKRTMAADAAAETILASHGGGGNWDRALLLAEEALDAIALADGETCGRITLHFLWQWVDFLGLRPEFDCCPACGKPVSPGSMLIYSSEEGGMVCSECHGGQGMVAAEAGPGCRHWLATVRELSPQQLSRFTLDKTSFRQAKALVTTILTEAFGKRLTSWDW